MEFTYTAYHEKVDFTYKPEVSRLSEHSSDFSADKGSFDVHDLACTNYHVDKIRCRYYLIDSSRDEVCSTYHFADLEESVVDDASDLHDFVEGLKENE